MPHEMPEPPAIVRATDDGIVTRLVRVAWRLRKAETETLDIGRELLALRELCTQAGRGWLDELARSNIPRSTAHDYMRRAEEADRPPAESPMSGPGHDGPIAEEESSDAEAATPVRRREPRDAPTDDPRETARRAAIAHVDGLRLTLPPLDLLDRHAADLHRLDKDLERAARPG